MSTALNSSNHIIRRRERPRLFGNVRVESPFPKEAYYQIYRWADPVWNNLADDLVPHDPVAFTRWQEEIDSQENVLTWGVWRGQELGGIIRFILNPSLPWTGEGHCLFKKDFWGRETTATAILLVSKELFEERGLKKINMPTFKSNHSISALLKHIGAKLEADMRRTNLQNGVLIDTRTWGYTPEDFEQALKDNPGLMEGV